MLFFAFLYVSPCGARYIITHSFTDSTNFLASWITLELSSAYNSILVLNGHVSFVYLYDPLQLEYRIGPWFFPFSDTAFLPFPSIRSECCSFTLTIANIGYVVNN